MTKLITQFMWAFQHTFRRSVEYEIQKTLSGIGLRTHGKARVLVIGFANKDGLLHEICIEPEGGPLLVEDLDSIEARTEAILKSDPEFGMRYSVARIQERKSRDLFLRSRAHAISEAIQGSGKFEGLRFFVSKSAPIEGYDVHTCVGISSEIIESVPRFNNPNKSDFLDRHIEESFLYAIINSCLQQADRALYLPAPGEGLGILGDRLDIVRSSAERFVQQAAYSLTRLPADLFRLACEISSLTYERSGAKGHLVVTGSDNLVNKLKITFQDPVSLHETRSARKILELTDETKVLLSDGQVIYGLGECISAPDVAKIAIEGHARWSLSIGNTALVKVAYGQATLPKQILDKELFRDVALRKLDSVDVDRIWDVFQCALDNDHGTTIVISQDPISEIKRLGRQALAIKPEYLSPGDVARLGRIDGAIVLGPDGRCYAFGVILDGLATSSGDRARGARFNSSVRYQKTAKLGTIVIVISDDGTVDLIPHLMPRISRQEVEDVVRSFCKYSGIKGGDGEEWAKRNDRVEEIKFYLNEEQCNRVNEAYEKEMDSRLESKGIKLHRKPLQPEPDMDGSYFIDG